MHRCVRGRGEKVSSDKEGEEVIPGSDGSLAPVVTQGCLDCEGHVRGTSHTSGAGALFNMAASHC